jgi:hypothetical protein
MAADLRATEPLPGLWITREYTVATVPDVAVNKGLIIYVSNGDTGTDCLARSDGTNWLRIPITTAIAAS